MSTFEGAIPRADARKQLAAELRRLRGLAGVSGRQLANRVGISQSKLSRIENGSSVPSVPEVMAWCQSLETSAEVQAALRQLTEASHSEVKRWLPDLDARGHLQDDIKERESAAHLIHGFQSSLVPGLLQTAAYARRVFELFPLPYADEQLAKAVTARADRQLALFDPHKQFHFLITESALLWRPGPPHILLAQLDRIGSLSTMDNISIGLIPNDAETTTTISHSFVIYRGLHEDDTVAIETAHADMLVRAPEDVDLYRAKWKLLHQMALVEDQARDFLASLAGQIRHSMPNVPSDAAE